jgi:hypothetical protein
MIFHTGAYWAGVITRINRKARLNKIREYIKGACCVIPDQREISDIMNDLDVKALFIWTSCSGS